MIMLDLHNIETGYDAGQVLFGVSLNVPAGACVSLMGRNGMGKTTTVRAIMGQLPLTGGRISRFGDDHPAQSSFEIARAGIGLLILDEATEGLAPIIRQQIWDCLSQLKQDGQSILIIDKNVDAIARLADHNYILDKGRVVWHGDSKSLLATADLKSRYLGV